jgi:hypothetical protein
MGEASRMCSGHETPPPLSDDRWEVRFLLRVGLFSQHEPYARDILTTQVARCAPAPSRFAHLEWAATTSLCVAGRASITVSPHSAYLRPSASIPAAVMGGSPCARSCSVTDRIMAITAPARVIATRFRMIAGSARRRPRRSEPQGKWMVSSSANPWSSTGNDSAAATTNSAFARPPRRSGRDARRDASTIESAFASTPTTNSSGSAAARRSTNRPSPVPRSMADRRKPAVSSRN